MDNNKGRLKERPKSNVEMRKIDPKNNSDLGIINGEKIGSHAQGKNPDKTYEWLNK